MVIFVLNLKNFISTKIDSLELRGDLNNQSAYFGYCDGKLKAMEN